MRSLAIDWLRNGLGEAYKVEGSKGKIAKMGLAIASNWSEFSLQSAYVDSDMRGGVVK